MPRLGRDLAKPPPKIETQLFCDLATQERFVDGYRKEARRSNSTGAAALTASGTTRPMMIAEASPCHERRTRTTSARTIKS